jgi:hypothetical protein
MPKDHPAFMHLLADFIPSKHLKGMNLQLSSQYEDGGHSAKGFPRACFV